MSKAIGAGDVVTLKTQDGHLMVTSQTQIANGKVTWLCHWFDSNIIHERWVPELILMHVTK
jgi:uncharacterized protein YodC (DUF2158 family)